MWMEVVLLKMIDPLMCMCARIGLFSRGPRNLRFTMRRESYRNPRVATCFCGE